LQSLVDSGPIKARTKWKQIYPSLANDERYTAMLGNPGSNPIELFWDVVDRLDQRLDEKIAVVERAVTNGQAYVRDGSVNDHRAMEVDQPPPVGPDTTIEEFKARLGTSDEDVVRLSDAELSEIFCTVSGREDHRNFTETPLCCSYRTKPSRSKRKTEGELNGDSGICRTTCAMHSRNSQILWT
jgi:hypothetical protein